MPIRPCADPRCPNPATYRGRCSTHARQREQQTNRAGRKLYRTAKWKRTRNRYLFNHSLCEQPGCEQIATDVHHIQDLDDGGDPWNASNLQALCHSHHSKLTRAKQIRTS